MIVTLFYVVCIPIYMGERCQRSPVFTRENTTIEECHDFVNGYLKDHFAKTKRKIKWHKCREATPAEKAKHYELMCRHNPAECKNKPHET